MHSAYSTIEDAIDQIRQGGMIVIADDKERENEGDIVMAASTVTSEQINFLMREARGLICMPLSAKKVRSLGIRLMDPYGEDRYGTVFLQSVDVKEGTTTGISASDRANTVHALMRADARMEQFYTPGHMFPLAARAQGVLERRGHTEASVDIVRIAGKGEAAVICEVSEVSGSMAHGQTLIDFAVTHRLPVITIEQLVAWRVQHETMAVRLARATLPTPFGQFELSLYEHPGFSSPVKVMSMGKPEKSAAPLVRLNSECFTGDVLGSERCDCRAQLELAMEMVAKEGSGMILYLPQEGRGIGLVNKIKAYALQEQGLDTVEANEALHLPVDGRNYAGAAQLLHSLGLKRIRLLSNNPKKRENLLHYGIAVTDMVAVRIPPNRYNERYLRTKQVKLGHDLGFDGATGDLPRPSSSSDHHTCPRRIPQSLHIQFDNLRWSHVDSSV